MQRTPPRRSPRFNTSEGTTSAVNMESSATPSDALAAASTGNPLEVGSIIKANVNDPPGPKVSASLAEANIELLTASSSQRSEEVSATNSTTALMSTSIDVVAKAGATCAPSDSVNETTHQQRILIEMQRKLQTFESELRNTQIRLSERDLQCQSLKEALQNRPVPSVASTFSQWTPPFFVQPTVSVHSTVPVQSTLSTQSSGCTYTQPAVSVHPPVSFANTFTTLPNSSGSLPNHTSFTSVPSNSRTHLSSSTWFSPPQFPQMTPTFAASQSGNSQYQFSTPRKLQDLPEFSGAPEDWPMFSTAFVESTAAYNYSNLENSMRLQKCLKGEARNVVKCMMIHANNVDLVMDQLRSSFGRPEQLIDSQLQHVHQIAPISESSLERLIPFGAKVRNLAVFLSSINGQHHLANPTLLKELVSKLPMSQRIGWAGFAATIQPYPTIVDFSNWLNGVANLVAVVQNTKSSTSHVTLEQKRRPVLHAAESQTPDTHKCPICQRRHRIQECKRFLEFSVDERWTQVKRCRLCFTCLEVGHALRNCRLRRRACGVNGCLKGHHQLLHESKQPNTRDTITSPTQQQHESKQAVLSCTASPVKNSKLLFRVLPVTVYGSLKRVDTYALLDEGSSITMMNKDLIEELGLKGNPQNLDLQWFGGRAAKETAIVVNVHISGTQNKRKHVLRNVYGVTDLQLPMQSLNECDLRGDSRCFKWLPVLPYTDVKPQILIGLDHCHLGLPSETISLREGGPYAAHTELGWVVFGPTQGSEPLRKSCMLVNRSEDVLHELVAEYFSTESFGVRPAPVIESEADVRARSILESTTIRVNGRFQTGLLWKHDNVELPDSYTMAKRRLIAIERKMKKDDKFAAAYNDIITTYVKKGYARKLQPAEASKTSPRTWYLPHFAVVNPNKPGKLRLVFDAAATVNGTSLNSCLLKGPQEYQPMPSVLSNFRVGAVAVCGDIREMFHQVLIRPEDRDSQRFLWRNNNDNIPPDVYEMIVMTFGSACSPSAAQHVKTINALKFIDTNARAVKSILQHHYVDDLVDSFASIEEAITVTKEVQEIHKAAGFELRGFTSNSREVLAALENGAESNMVAVANGSLIDRNLGTEKVLGMYWQPFSDTFRYQLKFHHVDPDVIDGNKCPSKRELLSVVMSVFDPLGFLANFLILAKLMMREVWRCSLHWDETLPNNIQASWIKWCKRLRQVIEVKIPRYYFIKGLPQNLQLHIFCDASEEAFAAVAYWRYENLNEEVAVSFIRAKTKCAPLKPMTIPRLELQAAVLGSRLMQTIVEEHTTLQVARCILWTDSKTVIKWITSQNRRYKPFVAHRVAEIISTTGVSSWRWVPTQDNVADEGTRPNCQTDFSPSSRWLTGPKFLELEDNLWPASVDYANISQNRDAEEEELRPKFALLTVGHIKFSKFSSFLKLRRTIGYVIRYVRRLRHISADSNSLTVEEIQAAEFVLYRHAQAEVYGPDINRIKHGQCVDKSSSLYKFLPYVDEEGVLRVSGRIDAASWLPRDTRRPIILPPEHVFTELVVKDYHWKMKHQNVEATICEIRRLYWIPRLRAVLRKVINKCNLCKFERVKPVTPLMGPLPEDRLTPFVRPFTYTGLDYFGPLTVTVGRRVEKRWVALFTCLVVRAIHLEVAHDLSTDACILTLRNFINRRGVPVRIRSDNGKNFVGTDREAKRFSEVFDCDRIQDELSAKGVEWVFTCPSNPSEGGVWERMVQSVKRVLRHTLKEISPREHTLQCLLIEAENVVNSRPLTHLPISIDQEEPLTPNHFLLGTANTAQTPRGCEPLEELCRLGKQWRIARQLRDRFWKRWISEYLPTLTCRTKWCERTEPVKEGDLVFICDSDMPRKQWCRGIVKQVYKGRDGVIRRADVRTKTGILRRPVSKLAVLSLDSESG